MINKAFEGLSKKYPRAKFLKTISTKCVENFPDSNLPYILYYRNGELQKQINITLLSIYPTITEHAMEHLFGEIGIEGFKKIKSQNTKEFIADKLGRKHIEKRSDESDDDEREDKQFVSNKVFIKY